MRIPPQPIKADLSCFSSPEIRDILATPEFQSLIKHANDEYLYWDKFRYRPMPPGIADEQAWAYLKMVRAAQSKTIPFMDKQGHPFSFWLPDSVLKTLSQIDRGLGKVIGGDGSGDLPSRERYIITSLMEEAIASSQLEGAATTRAVAKEMLKSGRKPRNHGEQMIVNNWMTIQHLRGMKNKPLTREMLCEIQAMITDKTLKDPNDAGRLRTDNEIIVEYDQEIIHVPPDWKALEERIEMLCRFANNDNPWIHPVVKAAILHFRLGYDHYFVDGNGRTARAIFYWYLLSRGYWLFEYLVISKHFLKAPVKYVRAYMYTETGDGDMTYFIVHSLNVVQNALEELNAYLGRKQREMEELNKLLRIHADLNHRQRELFMHALKHPEMPNTVVAHKNMNRIAYDTARNDLQGLADRGLMERHKAGKTYLFRIAPAVRDSLNAK